MVPHEKWKWFVDRSDNSTSFEAAIFDLVVGQYNFPDPKLLQHFYCTRVAHRFISQTLPNLAAPTYDELVKTIDEIWGTSFGRWKELDIYSSTHKVVLRLACRVIVGPELSENEDFLAAVAAHEKDVVRVAMIDPFIPRLLRPMLGPYLLALPNWWHFRHIRQLVLPSIETRLKDLDREGMTRDEVPKDYITWHIQISKADGKLAQLKPEWIAKSFLPILFGTVHGTHATLVNFLLNALSSAPERRVLGFLKDEVENVSREFNGVWDKKSLSRLVHTDSAIRESMRLDGLTAHVLYRKVVAEAGLADHDEGWTLPKGTTLAVDAWTRHRDPEIYDQPDDYDAFRFSRQREYAEDLGLRQKTEGGWKSVSKVGVVNASDSFLTFGLGRHACPGRGWVDIALKMFVAHTLMNYDMQCLPNRPRNTVHGPYALPNEQTTIRVRRCTGAMAAVQSRSNTPRA